VEKKQRYVLCISLHFHISENLFIWLETFVNILFTRNLQASVSETDGAGAAPAETSTNQEESSGEKEEDEHEKEDAAAAAAPPRRRSTRREN
jgi:hypothetical protein